MWLLKSRIYADTAAATPIDRVVQRVLTKTERQIFGNASSLHQEGVVADKLLNQARLTIAKFASVQADEVIFTSGGSESNSLAIGGVVEVFKQSTNLAPEIVVSAIEHQSILEAAKSCARYGAKVITVPVDKDGRVILAELKKVLSPHTAIVSVGYVNNEIGTVNDLRGIAKEIRLFRKQTSGSVYPYFHTDACQAPRFLPCLLSHLGVDVMTLNSAKVYGPKGVGCLLVKRGTKLHPQIVGGGQEFGLRSGTQNVPGIVAFATALSICEKKRQAESEALSGLRDVLINKIENTIPDAIVYGPRFDRAPNNINIGFTVIEAEQLVIGLDVLGVAVSTGSACSSKAKPESQVLKALGAKPGETSIRLTLGRGTTKKDIDRIYQALLKVINRNRKSNLLIT